MNNLALLFGSISVYWHGVFMALAIALAVIVSFIMQSAFQDTQKNDLLNCILLSMPLGFVFSRIVYWSCNSEEYETFADHLNFTRGGYALYGAIIGALISAAIIKKINSRFNAGAVCDCMAAGAALGIVVGRLSAYFSGDNIGLVIKSEKLHFFPLTVYNAQKEDWIIAVFSFEAFFSLVIFAVLCVLFSRNSNEKTGMKAKHGDIALLFLLMHGCSQGLFDSMHVDALLVPGNSFVRLQQILGAVFFTTVMIIFAVRSKKKNGFMWYQVICPLIAVAAVGVTLWMELDRISYHNFIRNYSIIFISMLSVVISGLFIYNTTLNDDTAYEFNNQRRKG